MNRKILIYVIFTIQLNFSSQCFASFEDLGIGAQYQAMGGTSVAFANTADAAFRNCSGLAQTQGYAFSFYYSNLFGIKELNLGTFSGAIPTNWGTLGLAAKTFGNKLYSENEYIFSYANKFFHSVYFGVSVRYMDLSISRYGSDATIGLDCGFIAPLSSKVNWGFWGHNLNRPHLGSKKEPLPQSFVTGIHLKPIEAFFANFEVYKDTQFPVELRCGIEYTLLNHLALRSGFSTEPSRFSAGFGVFISIVKVDYAFTTHNDLGATHHFSFSFNLNRKQPAVTKKKPPAIIVADKININTATKEQLQRIKGIGPTIAERIVQYRTEHGKFTSIDELTRVKGIGPKLLQKMEPYITIE